MILKNLHDSCKILQDVFDRVSLNVFTTASADRLTHWVLGAWLVSSTTAAPGAGGGLASGSGGPGRQDVGVMVVGRGAPLAAALVEFSPLLSGSLHPPLE